jgi:hypothetical protein
MLTSFPNLPANNSLNTNLIKNNTFVRRYGLDYFKQEKTLRFLTKNVAFIFFDGHLKKSFHQTIYYFRYKNDAELFKKEFLSFFPKEKPSLNNSGFCYNITLCNKDFASLLNLLGVEEGNKTRKKSKIPNWIFYGENSLKKEFLSVAIGNEGSAPSNNRWRIQFVLSKNKDNLENLICFLNELRQMLYHFNITTSYIQLRKQNKGNRKYNGRFYIKGKENLLRFYKTLKFAYASEKQEILIDLLKRHKYI